MACYMNRKDMIGFASPDDLGDDWVRLDADEAGVTVDRGGLCRLDRNDCDALIRWLVMVAASLPDPGQAAEEPQGRGRPKTKPSGRHNRRREEAQAC
jgi:hypothetical protein